MKKLTKFLAIILACITVFSTASLAAEGTLPNEEATTAAVEETTLPAEEETTAPVEDETTAPAEEETTAPAEEETTAPAEEETTAPAEEETTAPAEEETTAPAEEETTAPAEEETTEAPEEETTEPEIVLPEAPISFNGHYWYDSQLSFTWSDVIGADGYALYQKKGDEWVIIGEYNQSSCDVGGFLYNSKFDFAIKSYIEVDGVKYYSEAQKECSVETPDNIGQTPFKLESVKDGIKVSWKPAAGMSGYRVYVYKNRKHVKLASVAVNGDEVQEFIYKDAEVGKTYEIGIMPYSKGNKGTVFGSRIYNEITHSDFTKSRITSKSATSSSVTLKWTKVDGAGGYRVYVYKDGKWKYYKGIKTEEYTVKSLKDATSYKFKVRAFFKEDGKTIWGTYSDEVSVTTKGKTVKASRISKLKKYFTDGDWCIKLYDVSDNEGGKFDMVMAGKGTDLFVRYVYGKETIEYLCKLDKNEDYVVYMIYDKAKEYVELKEDDANFLAYSFYTMAEVLKLDNPSGVTAKTTTYKGKRAVAEIFMDKDIGVKKTYYFINDKLSGVKVVYADGSTESFKSIKITDTPSASVFKIPSGYKKVSY